MSLQGECHCEAGEVTPGGSVIVRLGRGSVIVRQGRSLQGECHCEAGEVTLGGVSL